MIRTNEKSKQILMKGTQNQNQTKWRLLRDHKTKEEQLEQSWTERKSDKRKFVHEQGPSHVLKGHQCYVTQAQRRLTNIATLCY